MEDAPPPVADLPAAVNGSAAHEDDIVAVLRKRVDRGRERLNELQAQASEISHELRRYEKALALLTDETPAAPRGPYKKKATQTHGTGVSAERVAEIERVIREFAKDHEEFRQVDIRTLTQFTSSIMATTFETLRQRNVIRFARAEGNNKWFRLTREALRDQ